MGFKRRTESVGLAVLRSLRLRKASSLVGAAVCVSPHRPAAVRRFGIHALVIAAVLLIVVGGGCRADLAPAQFAPNALSPAVAAQSDGSPSTVVGEEREPSSRHGRESLAGESSTQADQTAQEKPQMPIVRYKQRDRSIPQGTDGERRLQTVAKAVDAVAEAAPTATPPAAASGQSDSPVAPINVEVSSAIDSNPAHWQFLREAIEPARASQRNTGVPASVTIAQAIHESAWGTSRLSREGHNYFGIKATNKAGTRGVIDMRTGEHIGGVNVSVIAGFRAYNNMTESFTDHGRFFLENSRYSRAMASKNDPRAFIRLVAEAGYATDPAYTRKVLAYMDKFNLYQYDR